jgi:hypothetical protein
MKYLYMLLVLMLIGCDQLIRPQEQSVVELENDIFFTTCSGVAETIGSCYQKAKRTCNGKYEIIKEFRDSSGVHRELTFQCKR